MTHSRARGKWERVIAALLVSRSDVEAAGRAGVSRSTLARLKRDTEFQESYQRAKDSQLESAIDSLRGNANTFVDTLHEIAKNKRQRGAARVRAAEVGLNALSRFVELEDLLRRVAALEEVAGKGEK